MDSTSKAETEKKGTQINVRTWPEKESSVVLGKAIVRGRNMGLEHPPSCSKASKKRKIEKGTGSTL